MKYPVTFLTSTPALTIGHSGNANGLSTLFTPPLLFNIRKTLCDIARNTPVAAAHGNTISSPCKKIQFIKITRKKQ